MAFTQISQWEQLSGNLASVISAEANFTLSSFMMNELASSYQIAILGTKNDLSNEYRKMTEFHCQHGIRGHNLDCRMCNWIALSLECTYIDRATRADMRRGYQLTMDAVITPGGLSRELENIRLGPITYHGATGLIDNDGLHPIAQIRDAGYWHAADLYRSGKLTAKTRVFLALYTSTP